MKTELVLLGNRISLASRGRRRWIVILVHAGFVGYLVGSWFIDRWNVSGTLWLPLPLMAGACLLSRMTGPLRGRNSLWRYKDPPASRIGKLLLPKEPEAADMLDERELRWRDRAHYWSYGVLSFGLLMLWVFISQQRQMQFMERGFPVLASRHPWGNDNMLFCLAACLLFAAFTLPQTLLLWFAPDMEEPHED